MRPPERVGRLTNDIDIILRRIHRAGLWNKSESADAVHVHIIKRSTTRPRSSTCFDLARPTRTPIYSTARLIARSHISTGRWASLLRGLQACAEHLSRLASARTMRRRTCCAGFRARRRAACVGTGAARRHVFTKSVMIAAEFGRRLVNAVTATRARSPQLPLATARSARRDARTFENIR